MSLVAIAGQTFRLRVELESQAAAGTFQSSPTVAAGDVKLLVLPASPAGTEAYANSTNAPTALNGPTAQVVITADETTAAGDGGEIIAVWADAAGDEWYSVSVHIQVKAADLPDTGDVPTTAQIVAAIDADPPAVDVTLWSGGAVAAADANGNVPVVLYPTQGAVTFAGQVRIEANAQYEGALHILNISADGSGQYNGGGMYGQQNYSANGNGQTNLGAGYGQENNGGIAGQYNTSENAGQLNTGIYYGIKAVGGTAATDPDFAATGGGPTAQDIADALLLAPVGEAAEGSAMAELAAILEDTETTLPALIAGVGAGSGTGYYSDTVESPAGTPLDGVRVVLATDEAGENLAYEARTDAFGVFEMRPDPGTYYRFIEAAGHGFAQGVEVEVTEP